MEAGSLDAVGEIIASIFDGDGLSDLVSLDWKEKLNNKQHFSMHQR